jgi:putative oxidoreductase
MKAKIPCIARILLGLIFFVFGLNGFINFIPYDPNQVPPAAMAFSGAMMATGYFFPVLKATEVICGALLLSGFYVPLALVILAPITIQIFLFHSMLTPGVGNLVMPIVMIALHLTAASKHWALYRPLLQPKQPA